MKIKSAEDLRTVLSDEISNLRRNKRTATDLNAITKATGKILDSVRMELQFYKMLGVKPNIGFINSKTAKLLPASR